MALNVTHTLSNNQTSDATQINTNFSDIETYINTTLGFSTMTKTSGNILVADGTNWNSSTPDAASVVTKTATQTLTNKTLTSPTINTGTVNTPTIGSPVINGTITGNAFLDEDDMASNSATKTLSQQSAKAYVATMVANHISTGTYTGDGSTGKAITGVLFAPKYVRIWPHPASAAATSVYEKLDQTWADYAVKYIAAGVSSAANMINSLDASGFTVDDAGADSHPNKNLQVYDYLVLG